MIKKAVIVAAGLSSRLYPLTLEKPKCLLHVGGQELLLRNLDLLKRAGIEEIAIVVGYRKEDIVNKVGQQAVCIYNPFYSFCNNMGSLWFAKSFVENEPFLYLHGDVVFSEKALQNFLQINTLDTSMNMLVDFKETDEEAMKVRVTRTNLLIESSKEVLKSAGEWTGIATVHEPKAVFEYIEQALSDGNYQVYDTYAFTNMCRDGHLIQCEPTMEEPWVEIDFLDDYNRAKEIFGE